MKLNPYNKRERLRRMIKALYVLRDILNNKNEQDRAFKKEPKPKLINDLNEIIDLSLEEYYA